MEKNSVQVTHSFEEERPLAVLIDFSNLMYRNYHALRAQEEGAIRSAKSKAQAENTPYVEPKPRFSAPDGTPTGALLLSLNKIDTVIRKLKPSCVALVLEGGGKQERVKVFADYKANRKPADDGLKKQMELAQSICASLGIAILKAPAREADDVLVGAAARLSESGFNCVLCTSDKDMYQSIGPNVGILPIDFKEVVIEGSASCEKKFGVTPDKIVDYLSLVGDAVDGIPGVPQIGPVSAVKLLNEFGSVEQLIEKAKEGLLPPKSAVKILEHEAQLRMSKQLASALPLEHGWEQMWSVEKNMVHAQEILRQLNMNSFLKKISFYENLSVEVPQLVPSPVIKKECRM